MTKPVATFTPNEDYVIEMHKFMTMSWGGPARVAGARRVSKGNAARRWLGRVGLLAAATFGWSVQLLAGSLAIAWDPVTSVPVSGYVVSYGTTAGSYTATVDAGNVTTTTLANLTDGATYYFAVQAYDASGTRSSYSNEVSATVAAAPVANFSASTTSGPAPLALNFLNTSTGTITSYSWSFGDGTTSTAPNPSKVYNAAGSYTVSLTVSGPAGTNTNTKSNYITVSAPPVANFTATPTSGSAPLTVRFTSTSTGNITVYSWSFGDGTTSTTQNPTKIYSAAGTYTVALTAIGPGGSNTKTVTGMITVSATDTTAPTAPSGVVATAASSSQIDLNWTASTDNVGVTGYRVERCQGTGCTNFAQVATTTTTTYSSAGLVAGTEYRHRVRAYDAAGNASAYSTVAVATTLSGAPNAAFTVSTSAGPAPLSVTFTNLSTGNITGYSWSFGDGTGSTVAGPTKSYTTPGVYTVSLTVTGPGGSNTQTLANAITVLPPGTTGALSGTDSTRTTSVDLTSVGSSDWVAWAGNTRKATGLSQIGSLAAVSATAWYRYTGDSRKLSWTDGSPAATGTSTDGFEIPAAVGAGFRFTVPADTTTRTLVVYVGGTGSYGKLTASLSDQSAPAYTSSTIGSTWNRYDGTVTLTYRAAAPGQTLTVAWLTESTASGGRRSRSPGTVRMQGAALR